MPTPIESPELFPPEGEVGAMLPSSEACPYALATAGRHASEDGSMAPKNRPERGQVRDSEEPTLRPRALGSRAAVFAALVLLHGCGGEPSPREVQNARAFEALLTAVALKNKA